MKTMEPTINNLQGEIRQLDSNVEETRTVTFVASTDAKDRHGTVLNQSNWDLKNFNSNPIIGYQHNVYGEGMCEGPNPDDQLGTAKAYLETTRGDSHQLLVDITFEPEEINPKAEKIFRKILHGSLRAVSVGFVPLTNDAGGIGEDREGAFHYHGQELLEVSVVNIPSNPEALKRSFRDSTSSALRYLKTALNLSFSQVENLRISQVLDMLEGKEVKQPELKKDFNKKYCELQEKQLLLNKNKSLN